MSKGFKQKRDAIAEWFEALLKRNVDANKTGVLEITVQVQLFDGGIRRMRRTESFTDDWTDK